MNTNHNRIRVSDLETDERDKILATNSKGELEFIATKNIKVDSYNALDYDQEGKALDARQGKILKDLVNNKTDKGGFQGTAQDLANSIPDLNSANLKLGSYPSTRNDGQLSTNKVLSTDASGNLKLYSLPISSIYPAPYLTEILPYNFLPNTTGNIILKGSFFTPAMTVVIQGQTVNYVEFKSDNEVNVNVTTGSAEGNFDVILNNGLSATFFGRMLIVLGTVFTPIESDWTSVSTNLDITEGKAAKLKVINTVNFAKWLKLIPASQDFEVHFTFSLSPFLDGNYAGYENRLNLVKTSDVNQIVYGAGVYGSNFLRPGFMSYFNDGIQDFANNDNPTTPIRYKIRRLGQNVSVSVNDEIKRLFSEQIQIDMYISIELKYSDIINIKYIELAT